MQLGTQTLLWRIQSGYRAVPELILDCSAAHSALMASSGVTSTAASPSGAVPEVAAVLSSVGAEDAIADCCWFTAKCVWQWIG